MDVFFSGCISAVIAALTAVFAPILLEKLKFKHQKEAAQNTNAADIAALQKEIKEYRSTTTEQIKASQTETATEIQKLRELTKAQMDVFETNIVQIASTTSALVQNEIARTYINIRKRALFAIRAGSIKAREKEELMQEFERYKKLPSSNGFLNSTIEAMNALPVIVDDDDV